jgi:hypothetical protein
VHAHTPTDGQPIVSAGPDSVRLGEHRTALLLRGEFGAALTATVRQDGATGTRTHAQAEAVHLGATTVVRLEGSLAHQKGLSIDISSS